jgi:hypothetical protein
VGIKAFKTLDCHQKLRVHYRLAQPVTLERLKDFGEYALSLNEFSKIVAGAKDHFTLSKPTVRACGVVGEEKFVVTFAKTDEAPAEIERAAFEESLQRVFAATIEYLPARLEVV